MLNPRAVCSAQDVGNPRRASWCPFGRARDQAGDQAEDENALDGVRHRASAGDRLEILGAPVVELEVAADRPLATLVVRLCDVRPDGERGCG